MLCPSCENEATRLGQDGTCAWCHAKAAVDQLEPLCSGDDSAPLDELWLVMRERVSELGTRIETLWAREEEARLRADQAALGEAVGRAVCAKAGVR